MNSFWIRTSETKPTKPGKYFTILEIKDPTLEIFKKYPMVLWWDGNNFLQNMYGKQSLTRHVIFWAYIPNY